MNQGTITRASAKFRTRVCQAALGAVIVGGAAVAYWGRVEHRPVGDLVPPKVTLPSHAGAVQSVASLDLAGAASRLSRIPNRPQPIVTESVTPGDATEPPPVAPPANEPAIVRYLGPAGIGGGRAMALIFDGTKQRFAALGSSIGDRRLEAISPEAIILRGEAGEVRIERASRGSEVVSRLTGLPMARPMPPGRPGAQPQQPPKAALDTSGQKFGELFENLANENKDPVYLSRVRQYVNKLREEAPGSDPESILNKARELAETEPEETPK